MAEGRFPFVATPRGWYAVALSQELSPGEVKALRYFERDLVLFRGENGEANLLDAFCPHLGAHLGHGGMVKGNSIACPFHKWEFDGNGKCTKVPYAEKIPPKAAVPAWPVVEKNGLIMTWFDIEGKEPDWQLPDVPEVGSEDWTEFKVKEWKVKSHSVDMGENQVDVAHFRYLHGTQNYPDSEASIDGPIMRVYSAAGMDTPRGPADGTIESMAYAFGLAIVRFTGIVETLLIAVNTPVEAELVHSRFCFMVKKTGGADVTKGVAKAFIAEVSRQFEQDVVIWENKHFVHPPLLCDGDGPIGLYRKWIRQFFPEGTFSDLRMPANPE
jgi:3-ketosteroid 9alpha-monooxygenase subunit A